VFSRREKAQLCWAFSLGAALSPCVKTHPSRQHLDHFGWSAHSHTAQHLGAGAKIHMACNSEQTFEAASTKGDLLKDQTVGADDRQAMNDDTVGVGGMINPPPIAQLTGMSAPVITLQKR
jgi:hypothetical protein